MDFEREGDKLVLKQGGRIAAEIDFPTDGGVAKITHTFVDGSLRGQGVAGELMRAAVDLCRVEGKKIKPVCSYAVAWFDKRPEERDVLV